MTIPDQPSPPESQTTNPCDSDLFLIAVVVALGAILFAVLLPDVTLVALWLLLNLLVVVARPVRHDDRQEPTRIIDGALR